ncbi:MAG: hypothetical protein Q7J16_05730 [Candidatus Cloacimonadales bacterium]|nr:hypothetical protein [Candidatus Cloacimonadales bacterium]
MEIILIIFILSLIVHLIARHKRIELEKKINEERNNDNQISTGLKNSSNVGLCAKCNQRLRNFEIQLSTKYCSKCLLLDFELIRDCEKVVFVQQASYRGGLKGYPNLSKKSGFAFVLNKSFCYYDSDFNCKIDYENILKIELHKFQPSGLRSFLASGSVGRQLQEVKNNIAFYLVDDDGDERIVKFQIHGALTIFGEGIKATEFLNHLLDFKNQFKIVENKNYDPKESLKKLLELKQLGLISDEDYNKKKNQILNNM